MSPVIFIKNKDASVPAAFFEVLGKTNPTHACIALVDNDGDIGVIKVTDDIIPTLLGAQDNLTGRLAVFYAGFDKDVPEDHMQPYPLLEKDGNVILTAFLEGDFCEYETGDDSDGISAEENLVNEFLSEMFQNQIEKLDGNLDALVKSFHKDDENFDKLFVHSVKKLIGERGEIIIFANTGVAWSFDKNELAGDFTWGSSTQTMGYVEAMGGKVADAGTPATAAEKLALLTGGSKPKNKSLAPGGKTIGDLNKEQEKPQPEVKEDQETKGPNPPHVQPPVTEGAIMGILGPDKDGNIYPPAGITGQKGLSKFYRKMTVVQANELGKFVKTRAGAKPCKRVADEIQLAQNKLAGLGTAIGTKKEDEGKPEVTKVEPQKKVEGVHTLKTEIKRAAPPVMNLKSMKFLTDNWIQRADVKACIGPNGTSLAIQPKEITEFLDKYPSFTDTMGIKHPLELLKVPKAAWQTVCTGYPDAAEVLINQLLYENAVLTIAQEGGLDKVIPQEHVEEIQPKKEQETVQPQKQATTQKRGGFAPSARKVG